eukprot:Pgem_evm1s14633
MMGQSSQEMKKGKTGSTSKLISPDTCDTKSAKSVSQMQNAGFLAFFSAFVLVEGSTRVSLTANGVIQNGAGGLNGQFPPGVSLSTSLSEVVFGLSGFLVAMGILLYGKANPTASLTALIIQQIGWYTFIVFTFAQPIVDNNQFSGLNSDSQNNFAISCGILGSFVYCTMLQGGQMFFTFKIWREQVGDNVWFTAKWWKGLLISSSLLLFVAGLAQFFLGVLARSVIGTGELVGSDRIFVPPYAVVYPEVNIFAGILVMVTSLYPLALAVLFKPTQQNVGTSVTGPFSMVGPVMLLAFLTQVVCMGYVQASYIGAAPATAQIIGLTLLISLAPVICEMKMRVAYDDCNMHLVDNVHKNSANNSEMI